jgi:phosphorylase kinase alpha/beta subunit
MLVVHNEKILDFIKYRYSWDIQRLSAFLSENDVLNISPAGKWLISSRH